MSSLSFLIYFSVNGQPAPLLSNEAKHIRHELQSIRDKVNQLLDRIDQNHSTSGGQENSTSK